MTAETEIRIGVIGVGRIGKMHAELLARQVEGAQVVAVCDFDPAVAASVAASIGADAEPDADAILARSDVDAVAICSSTDTHADLMVAAAAAGKAIFCEKPVSLDLANVDRARAAVDAAGVPLQIGFNRRFDPAHQAVRDAVAAGEVGEIEVLRITSRDPAPPPMSYVAVSGGIFLDMTIHDFDMARYVTGSEVVEVVAQGAVRVDRAFAEYDDVDTAVVTLRHENGAFTVIDNSRRAAYGFDQRVEAFGSLGIAASENPLARTSVVRTAEGGRQPTLPYFFLDRYIPSYIRQWEAFVRTVRDGTPSPVSGADGRAPLVLGLAAWRSLREHRPVLVSEIDVATTSGEGR